MTECLNYKPVLVITNYLDVCLFFPSFFYSKDKGHSKKVVHELKVFQKVGDYNGNRHSSPQRGWEVSRNLPTLVLLEALGGEMASDGDGLPLTDSFLCT